MDFHRLRNQIEHARNVRTQLEERLLKLGPARAGSLLVRYAQQGRITTRKNKRGLKGPYYFLSWKGKHSYIRPGQLERLRRLLGNYKSFRRGLRDIQRYNRQVVLLLKRILQERLQGGAR